MSSSLESRPPLARSAIDRDHLARSDESALDALWRDPSTLVLAVWRDRVLAADDRLVLASPAAPLESALRLYLGRGLVEDAHGARPAFFAVNVDDETAAALADGHPGAEWSALRAIGHRLDDRDAGLATGAVALANWHAANGYSARSGTRTRVAFGGWSRVDDVDGREVHPRTDPAVIVAVTDDRDRLLLGSNAAWEPNRYSLLAGFVEPGESLEGAVEREVLEESGIRVADIRYVASQPWPFPASLMVGFTAAVAPGADSTAVADGTEIRDLRWFSRAELRAARDIRLPGSTSIARMLIERWLGEPLAEVGR